MKYTLNINTGLQIINNSVNYGLANTFRWKRCFSSTLFCFIFCYHVICRRIYIPRYNTYTIYMQTQTNFSFPFCRFARVWEKKWRDNRGATSRTTRAHTHSQYSEDKQQQQQPQQQQKKMYHERYFVVIIIVKWDSKHRRWHNFLSRTVH